MSHKGAHRGKTVRTAAPVALSSQSRLCRTPCFPEERTVSHDIRAGRAGGGIRGRGGGGARARPLLARPRPMNERMRRPETCLRCPTLPLKFNHLHPTSFSMHARLRWVSQQLWHFAAGKTKAGGHPSSASRRFPPSLSLACWALHNLRVDLQMRSIEEPFHATRR